MRSELHAGDKFRIFFHGPGRYGLDDWVGSAGWQVGFASSVAKVVHKVELPGVLSSTVCFFFALLNRGELELGGGNGNRVIVLVFKRGALEHKQRERGNLTPKSSHSHHPPQLPTQLNVSEALGAHILPLKLKNTDIYELDGEAEETQKLLAQQKIQIEQRAKMNGTPKGRKSLAHRFPQFRRVWQRQPREKRLEVWLVQLCSSLTVRRRPRAQLPAKSRTVPRRLPSQTISRLLARRPVGRCMPLLGNPAQQHLLPRHQELQTQIGPHNAQRRRQPSHPPQKTTPSSGGEEPPTADNVEAEKPPRAKRFRCRARGSLSER